VIVIVDWLLKHILAR